MEAGVFSWCSRYCIEFASHFEQLCSKLKMLERKTTEGAPRGPSGFEEKSRKKNTAVQAVHSWR